MRGDAKKIISKRSREASKKAKELSYQREYYAKHREANLAEKKRRYETDPAFKARAIANANARLKRLREEAKAARAAAGTASPNGKNVCKTCLKTKPRTARPKLMLLEKRYEVLMYPVTEISRDLGKNLRTVKRWVQHGVIPKALYKLNGVPLWTEDQIEAIKLSFSKFDLKPPVSYKECGLVDAVKKAWDALLPIGIDVKKYSTAKGKSTLTRPKHKAELSLRKRVKKFKACPECGRAIVAPPVSEMMLVEKKYEVEMFSVSMLANELRRSRKTIGRWIEDKTFPRPMYRNSAGHAMYTFDQMQVFRASVLLLEAQQEDLIDVLKLSNLIYTGFERLEPLGINPEKYKPTNRNTLAFSA